MSNLVKLWKEKKSAREEAERWNNLPKGKSYQGSKFFISIKHSKPPVLTRAGQQVCGGVNYWETEKEFNSAILRYIVQNWDNIYPCVIEIMKADEREKLLACQSFIDDMQQQIDKEKA